MAVVEVELTERHGLENPLSLLDWLGMTIRGQEVLEPEQAR